jgi:hypothetical protein
MADDPTTPPKKVGRPRVEPGGPVTTWLPTRLHDQLIAVARRRDESVSACLRRLVESSIAKKPE